MKDAKQMRESSCKASAPSNRLQVEIQEELDKAASKGHRVATVEVQDDTNVQQLRWISSGDNPRLLRIIDFLFF